MFIEAALSQQLPDELLPEPEELVVDFPPVAYAAHKVRLSPHGPMVRGRWIGFEPEGSANKAEAGTIYSAAILNGTEKEVKLIVPKLLEAVSMIDVVWPVLNRFIFFSQVIKELTCCRRVS